MNPELFRALWATAVVLAAVFVPIVILRCYKFSFDDGFLPSMIATSVALMATMLIGAVWYKYIKIEWEANHQKVTQEVRK